MIESLGEHIMIDSFVQQSFQASPTPATAADVMRPPLTTVEQQGHVAAAAYLMRHAGASALMVLHAQTDQPISMPRAARTRRVRHTRDVARVLDMKAPRLVGTPEGTGSPRRSGLTQYGSAVVMLAALALAGLLMHRPPKAPAARQRAAAPRPTRGRADRIGRDATRHSILPSPRPRSSASSPTSSQQPPATPPWPTGPGCC
jgi:hypothetical protein